MLIISSYSSLGIYQTLYGPCRYFSASILCGFLWPTNLLSSPPLLCSGEGRVAQWLKREGSLRLFRAH